MSPAAAEVFAQAVRLSADDQHALIEALSHSLSGGLPEPPEVFATDEEADAEWRAELDRRLQSVADGTAELMSPDDVFDRVREHLRQKRAGR